MTETASTALAPLAVPGDTRAQVLAPLTDLPREQLAAALATRYLLGYSGNTRAAYARDLADFFTWCQHVGTDPLTVTRSTVDLYARDLTERRSKSPATAARRLSTLSGFYRYAVSEDVLTRNPLEHVKRPKRLEDSPTLGLDRAEARQLLTAAAEHSPRARALVTLLLHDGLRVSEALAADVTDLAGVRGHRTLTVTRKGGARRSVVLNAATSDALDAYLDGRDAGPLFTTRTGGRWDRAEAFRTVRAVAGRAGIPSADKTTPHSLRHTFVPLAREAGVPLEDVQDAAGHADPRTTRRYDRGRHNLDRHPAYALGAYLAQ